MYNLPQNHVDVDCHKYSRTFGYTHMCSPLPPPPARLATPLAAASTCQQDHPRSSVLSRRAGGWLAHHSGIINSPEWQTLDVWRAVLSHPLLGVPQPPSLLPVNLRLLHLPSRAGIRSFRTLDAQSRVNDRTPYKAHT